MCRRILCAHKDSGMEFCWIWQNKYDNKINKRAMINFLQLDFWRADWRNNGTQKPRELLHTRRHLRIQHASLFLHLFRDARVTWQIWKSSYACAPSESWPRQSRSQDLQCVDKTPEFRWHMLRKYTTKNRPGWQDRIRCARRRRDVWPFVLRLRPFLRHRPQFFLLRSLLLLLFFILVVLPLLMPPPVPLKRARAPPLAKN